MSQGDDKSRDSIWVAAIIFIAVNQIKRNLIRTLLRHRASFLVENEFAFSIADGSAEFMPTINLERGKMDPVHEVSSQTILFTKQGKSENGCNTQHCKFEICSSRRQSTDL